MFSAFRRPSHPPSSSSHTASSSSASGSVISGQDSSTYSRRVRTPDTSNASQSAYDSDAPSRARSNSIGGWESDSRGGKAVRWNPASRLMGSKPSQSASGYSTDGPGRGERDNGPPRQRTYSSSRSKLSSSSSSALPPAPQPAPPVPAIPYAGDEFQNAVDRLLRISTKAFAITGTVPLFAPISLFFQTPTGSCHLLRFPSESSVPSRTFDAFMAACEPVSSPTPPGGRSSSGTYHTFRCSPSRPIVPSFDIASHPILNTIKSTLFPSASEAHHLVANLVRVDVYCPGASSSQGRFIPTEAQASEEEPCAHVVVTLPVRFRGGMMSVAKDGNEERFWGRGTLSAGSTSAPTSFSALDAKKVAGSMGSIEWIAYLSRGECDQKIEKVEKGVRINLVYDVSMRNYSPVAQFTVPRPLITPNDNLLAAVSSVLKRSRGMKLAFYLTNDYGVAPSHAKPDSLVPSLKGTDLALYHSLKFYNLQPALRYTAGGFIWPANACATISTSSQYLETMKRLALKSAGDDEDLTIQIEDGGGVRLEREGIVIVTGKEQGRIGSERLAFVDSREGKLEYLHVNVCLVVYVH